MKYLTFILFSLLFISCSENHNAEQSTETAEAELEQLLDEFLQGASVNNAEMHDRFWADDLIYTSSAGERFGKDNIMAGFGNENEENSSDEPSPQYGYEDLQIMVFDDTAVVAFQLVGTVGEGDSREVMTYYNTGTFMNRDNQWLAVAWQATRIP
jgi:hypothetical protein